MRENPLKFPTIASKFRRDENSNLEKHP